MEQRAHGQDLSAWDGVYWAITTITTVGYGDLIPATDAGRAIAVIVMLSGIGYVAILTAALAQLFLARVVEAERPQGDDSPPQLRQLEARVSRLEEEREAQGGP